MRALYCFSFGPKKEYIESDQKPVENPLGTALITLLSTDLHREKRKLASIDYERMMPMAIQLILTEVMDSLKTVHPFFENLLRSLYFENNTGRSLEGKLNTLIASQALLTEITDAVLLPDNSGLSAKQRLCLCMSRDRQTSALFAGLSERVRVERKIYVDGHSYDPIFMDCRITKPPEKVRFAKIEGSDDMTAALLTEVLEMVEQDVHVQKCEYCHRYFLPYSSKARYCDHISGATGKTCKELAAKEKHEKKIAADEGLKLLRQRIKTYDMRVRRAPTVYTDAEFQTWKAHVEQVRDLYVDGKLSFRELDTLTLLPKKKGEK